RVVGLFEIEEKHGSIGARTRKARRPWAFRQPEAGRLTRNDCRTGGRPRTGPASTAFPAPDRAFPSVPPTADNEFSGRHRSWRRSYQKRATVPFTIPVWFRG